MRTAIVTALIASLWGACRADAQEEHATESLAARVQKQISRLGSAEHSAAASAELRRLGPEAVPMLARALEVEKDRGATATTRGIVDVLASFGKDAEPVRPLFEQLAKTSIPLRKIALPALVRLSWPGGIAVAADYSQNRIVAFDPRGREVFTLEKVYGAWDVEMLENGNLLLTEFALNRVLEMTRAGKEVWSYEELKNPYDADRLPNGNTLIADTFGERVVEVNPEGEVVWEFKGGIKPYDVNRLANGNTLIADGRRDRIIEINPAGEIVWELPNMPSVHDVDRLPNGNTLVTQRTLHRVIEVDRDGKIVSRIEDLSAPSDADRLPNGHTIVAENGRVREFDRRGNVVWEKEVAWAVEVNRY